MRIYAKPLLLAVWAWLVSFPAHAHHSFGMFDQKKCLSIVGTVKKFQFEYPHIWLWITTEEPDHSQAVWGFQGADPATLAVHGWSQSVVKTGDKITVYFNPLIDGRKGGSLRHILASGKDWGAQGDEKVFVNCTPTK
jgi:hypothetical protein